jgi:hypothetical protein
VRRERAVSPLLGPMFALRELPCQSEEYDAVGADIQRMFQLADLDTTADSRPIRPGMSKRLQVH